MYADNWSIGVLFKSWHVNKEIIWYYVKIWNELKEPCDNKMHSGRANLRLAHLNLSSNIYNWYVLEFVFTKSFQQYPHLYCRTYTKKIDKPDIRPEIWIKLKLSGLL